MTTNRPSLTLDDVARHVREHVFDTDGGCDLVGVELEWLTSRSDDRSVRPTEAELRTLIERLGSLPRDSRITLEPGGQIEISTRAATSVDAACARAASDLYRLDTHARGEGVELIALGADPVREPERVVLAPRYDAMQAFFDGGDAPAAWAGRTMMCNTASVQVNLGLGTDGIRRRRWELANRLGPVLLATFANSPFAGGRPAGWISTRYRAWCVLDPSRAAPVPLGCGPADAYLDYLLAAEVMLIHAGADDLRAPARPLPFGQWLHHGHELGWPDEDDLAYHLTTLFPPVRPKGWLELRMLDALPTPYWQIAVAVTAVLLSEPDAMACAEVAVADVADLWVEAARFGLHHPRLAPVARTCMALALDVLERDDRPIADAAARFADRLTFQGRSPADDLLDRWRQDRELYPPPWPDLWSPQPSPTR